MGFVVPGFSLNKHKEAGYRFARIINQDIVRLEDERALKIQEDARVARHMTSKRAVKKWCLETWLLVLTWLA